MHELSIIIIHKKNYHYIYYPFSSTLKILYCFVVKLQSIVLYGMYVVLVIVQMAISVYMYKDGNM